MNQTKTYLPRSATHTAVGLFGLLLMLITLSYLRFYHPFGTNGLYNTMFLLGVLVLAFYLPELVWEKRYLSASTGLSFTGGNPSLKRSAIKYLGLLTTLAFMWFLYWIFPEYQNDFYHEFYSLAKFILPIWLIVAIPYFFFVDRYMLEPEDGYWQIGQIVLGRIHQINITKLKQYLLGWIIKGFFFPLMYCYMVDDLNYFITRDIGNFSSFKNIFDFSLDFLYLLDVTLATLGYFLSLRLLDTHVRSSEPTIYGWAVALVCYEPFWSLFGPHYFAYDNDISWGSWLWDFPLFYFLWGCAILLLTAIYAWATVSFGARFSNLTHRGIITSGPYRLTKHPAYIAKNLSWWLISVPFMADKPWDTNLKHCVLLLGVNLIYFLRAKTEEKHLSQDPDYRAYAQWISRHGLFSVFCRHQTLED